MQYREVQVKGILNTVRGEGDWFGLSYNMNLYRGCKRKSLHTLQNLTSNSYPSFNVRF